jgi:uncharacterized protein (DUF2141 family)
LKYTYRTGVQKFKTKLINVSTAMVVAFTGMTGAAPLFVTGTAHAAGASTVVSPTTLNGWAKSDMRGTGVAEITSQKADKNGGNGSLNLALSGNSDKAGFMKSANYGPVNDLSSLSFDWYRDSSSTAAAHFTPAVGIYVSDSSGSNVWLLKWEGVYNGYPVAGPAAPTNVWTPENLLSAKYWRIPQVVNGSWVGFSGCNQAGDPFKCADYTRTLQDDWLKGFDVVGMDVSVGSGWTGTYNSYVDNIKINDTTFNFEAAPVLGAENFNTVNDSTYTGISVGFNAKDFGTVTDVTVDMTRADSSHVILHGAQGIKDLLSEPGTVHATAPFVIKEGSYHPATDTDGNGHLYWEVAPTANWTTATAPTSVMITVTDQNGSAVVENHTFNQGAPSWPAYNDLVNADVPANLQVRFQYDSTYLTNGDTINKTVKPGNNNLELTWTDPASATVNAHITEETRPDGTSEQIWTGSKNVWLTAGNNNIGAKDGKAEFGSHGNGAYTYRVKVRNANNNQWSEWSQPFVLKFDNSSPTASFTVAPANNSFVNDNFHVEATASDSAGLKDVNFDVRDAQGWKAGCVSGSLEVTYSNDRKSATLSCDINTKNLTEGTQYYVRVHADDYAGYGSKDIAPLSLRYFTVDRTAPIVNLTAPQGVTNANSVAVKGSVTDSSMRYYACYITTNQAITAFGKTWTTGQEPKTGTNNDQSLADSNCVTHWTSTDTGSIANPVTLGNFDVSGLPDGSYTIHVHAHDLAGNVSEDTTTFTIDHTAPVVALTNPSGASAKGSGQYTVTGNVTDGHFGSALFTVFDLQGNVIATKTATVDSTSSNTSAVSATFDTTSWKNGRYNVKLTATDTAGNTSNVATNDVTINNDAQSNNFTGNAPAGGRGADPQGSSPQVQGASTTAALQSTAAPTTKGSVKGDSTEKTDTIALATDTQAKDTTKSGAFLGLGWWWLLILAIVGGLIGFLFRRADTNAPN